MTANQPDQTHGFLKNSAIAGAIICPLAMLLPPRKMDLRFFVLAGGFSMSTSHLAYVYTGESIYGRFQRRVSGLAQATQGLPPEAQRTQQILREHREQQERQQRKQGLAKVVDEVWMGGEDEDWQKRRVEEHQRSFEQGKGMFDIIIQQVADVWTGNWKPDAKKKHVADDGEGGSDAKSDEERRKKP